MDRRAQPIGLGACVCLLALQWSGLHVHATESGYIGVPEAPYTHSHVHHGEYDSDHVRVSGERAEPGTGSSHASHDYEDARDVPILELALGTYKMPLAILVVVFLCMLLPRAQILASTEFVYPVLSGRHTRWRPPLRAPPQLSRI